MTTLSRRSWLRSALGAALAVAATATTLPARAQAFDHTHGAWTALLRKHVRLLRGGQATQVHSAGFGADRSALKAYLDSLSAVSTAAFGAWPRPERQAFLINAYNAFTVKLILTRYPDLKSIKDLGSLLSSPWKPKWITLLGTKVSLDDIEHAMLRKRGDYDDPRVHFAANYTGFVARDNGFYKPIRDAGLATGKLGRSDDRVSASAADLWAAPNGPCRLRRARCWRR